MENIANGRYRRFLEIVWLFCQIELKCLPMPLSIFYCWLLVIKVFVLLPNRYAEKLRKLEILKRLKKEYEKR